MQNALNQARSLMSTDPETASQQLKLTLEKVRQTAELDPDVRDQFVDVSADGAARSGAAQGRGRASAAATAGEHGRRQRTAVGRQESGTQRR